MSDKSTLLFKFLKDHNITTEEAIEVLTVPGISKEDIEAKEFLELTDVGYLTKAFGLNGYDTAQVGHPVYEKKDRYVIFLTKDGNNSHEVSFYKETLFPIVSFYKNDTQ
jgi:hypothetical protein